MIFTSKKHIQDTHQNYKTYTIKSSLKTNTLKGYRLKRFQGVVFFPRPLLPTCPPQTPPPSQPHSCSPDFFFLSWEKVISPAAFLLCSNRIGVSTRNQSRVFSPEVCVFNRLVWGFINQRCGNVRKQRHHQHLFLKLISVFSVFLQIAVYCSAKSVRLTLCL